MAHSPDLTRKQSPWSVILCPSFMLMRKLRARLSSTLSSEYLERRERKYFNYPLISQHSQHWTGHEISILLSQCRVSAEIFPRRLVTFEACWLLCRGTHCMFLLLMSASDLVLEVSGGADLLLTLPLLLLTRGWPGLFLFLFLRTTGLVSLPRLPDFFLPLSDPLLSLSKDSASLSWTEHLELPPSLLVFLALILKQSWASGAHGLVAYNWLCTEKCLKYKFRWKPSAEMRADQSRPDLVSCRVILGKRSRSAS